MKIRFIVLVFITIISMNSCEKENKTSNMNIIFLHHSTGEYIWYGKPPSLFIRALNKISEKFADALRQKAMLPELFNTYNKEHEKNYVINEMIFPKEVPYGWNNFPYDYYNIWVKNAGDAPYLEEPTLEMLTKKYQVIVFKHCFPVSNIRLIEDSANIDSYEKTISNYKLQYNALKEKIHEFPETKFILFTGAVQVEANLPEDEAIRAKEFFQWVLKEWDQLDDNIYIWDFYNLQTEGGLYFKDEYAVSVDNSHPNKDFASRVSKLLFNRIIDIIENDGNKTSLVGELL